MSESLNEVVYQNLCLRARLAEAEALLKEARPWVCWCRDMIRRTDDPEDVKLHADATLASIDAFLAADSASACTCGGEYKYDGDCPVHGDPSFASDQPNAARKTVWKPYDVFGVTGRLVYEDTGEDVPDQPGEAAK